MYLINYFIYLYNFKAICDVTGSTTGPTPFEPVVREPLPFPVLFPVRFLKPCTFTFYSYNNTCDLQIRIWLDSNDRRELY